ncbi:(2Fe-2S)-binding protein [Marivita hallyeonensis]|uniref:Isoquinoline 1-oxidoreductase, alpha subunit n=1 Tax=Marivita hallyeonensis TaxID=996342 RepID=A0A1M5X3S4_9RHOB|nr:(2Fe-2S)-binding protein [Marivita hallyeonensis]SHH94487.1 isoquinoline 1-oxidoreductase, alpha subunit [Marivita hallyeonensis]
MTRIILNGTETDLDVSPDMPLLWALRDSLQMTGTKFGCGVAFCGACTVHIDGIPARACQTYIGDIEGAEVTTIEGVSSPEAQAIQAAWVELQVPQCGYCQSGQIMSASALLKETPKPTDEDIDFAMDGNLCRCATYARIRKAIHRAAEILEA